MQKFKILSYLFMSYYICILGPIAPGIRSYTSKFEDNRTSLVTSYFKGSQLDLVAIAKIDSSNSNVMTYTLIDVKSQTELVQHMDRMTSRKPARIAICLDRNYGEHEVEVHDWDTDSSETTDCR